MSHRKVVVATVVAFGVSFAAKPISNQATRDPDAQQQRPVWTPGADMLMSAHESGKTDPVPPR